MPVYKIRLNDKDAATGLFRKDSPVPANEQIEAWAAAVASTDQAIAASLPAEMRDALPGIMKRLPKERPDACCTRCNGSGWREDKPNWIDVPGDGKVCFKCGGHGVETAMLPTFFRRRVFDYIKVATAVKALEWANKVNADVNNPYRPLLMDAANLILAGRFKEVYRLPH